MSTSPPATVPPGFSSDRTPAPSLPTSHSAVLIPLRSTSRPSLPSDSRRKRHVFSALPVPAPQEDCHLEVAQGEDPVQSKRVALVEGPQPLVACPAIECDRRTRTVRRRHLLHSCEQLVAESVPLLCWLDHQLFENPDRARLGVQSPPCQRLVLARRHGADEDSAQQMHAVIV